MLQILDRTNLDRIFRPRSIAFVGASESPIKVGGRRWLTTVGAGFDGDLYPIHPKATTLSGIAVLPSIDAIQGPLDLVVIAIRPDAVDDVVKSCAAKNVGGVIVITGGFGESSVEGKHLEEKIASRLREVGARMIGPNCAGIYSSAGRVNATGMQIPAGPIGLITQSGNVLLDTAHRARRSGIGFSHAISMGNGVDLRSPELLAYMLADTETQAVVVYVEGWQEGEARAFCDIVRNAGRPKPVILVNPGKSDAGRRAALSHTGSLAAPEAVASAAFEQAGILQASSIDAAWTLAEALTRMPALSLPTIAVASDGGGHATLGCDEAEGAGFTIPEFSGELRSRLLTFLPERCPVANPVDYAGYAEEVPDVIPQSLATCLEDETIGAALLAGHFGGYHHLAGEAVMEPEREAAHAIGRVMRKTGKPILVHSVYADDAEPVVDILRSYGVPVVRGLAEAGTLLAGLTKDLAFRKTRYEPADVPAGGKNAVGHLIDRAGDADALMEYAARALLTEAGMPVPASRLAASADECVAAAADFGRPVALKISSERIIHKSDVGGVLLNMTPVTAAEGFNKLRAIAADDPDAAVLVTPMVDRGLELVIGATRDPQFGPVVMVGLGGVFVEVLKDVAFAVAPLTPKDAGTLLRKLRGYTMLKGYRGQEPVDEEALISLLVSLSRLVASEPRIREVDLNPVVARADGVDIVDARIILG